MLDRMKPGILFATLALLLPAASAQDPEPPPKLERWAFGFRVRAFSSPGFENSRAERSTASPVSTTTVEGKDASSVLGIAIPVVDVHLAGRFSLRTEFMIHRPAYERRTETFEGVDNSSTATDERTRTLIEEDVKATTFDIPVLLRYGGYGGGLFGKLFLTGGPVIRRTSKVSASNVITKGSDIASNDAAPSPSKRSVYGAAVGLGFRLVDDFNIKVTPEVRYVKWSGSAFDTEAVHSRKRQLEAGIAFTF
jgi:hypothetical protein